MTEGTIWEIESIGCQNEMYRTMNVLFKESYYSKIIKGKNYNISLFYSLLWHVYHIRIWLDYFKGEKYIVQNGSKL